jgi:broad specificity phosphatase PhoE
MNNSIRLILVRHGNTFEAGQVCTHVGARTDLSLTTEGREQAKRVGHYLSSQGIQPTAIYAGKLKRQIETSLIIGETLNVSHLHLNEPALTEVDFGLWEGLTTEAITKRWKKEYEDWSKGGIWPEGIFEGTLDAHLNEINNWIAHLRSDYKPGESIVGVTSNGIIRYFHSFAAEKWNHCVQTRNMEALKVKTGHLCELLLSADDLKVISWNKNPAIL